MSHIAALQAHVERERSERGLLEICFTPGSDTDVAAEDAAAVALAMLRYKADAA